jgi:Plasmid encoded RepA protein
MASVIQQRLLELSTDIATNSADELAFQHSILAQTSLPAARPPEDLLLWERRQGRATLLVEAGKVINPKTGRFEQLRLPYGPKARLLLMHLNSEAIRRQSPIIPVEDTMTAFFRRLMGRTQDGRQAKMLKGQLSALAAAQFRLGIINPDTTLQVNTQIIGAFNLWFEKDENQRVLWPAILKLSLDYYESLIRFAVPLDERAIAALAHSAIALDIYCWLAQRLHRIPKGEYQVVPWLQLHEQFGQGYCRVRKFREFFLSMLPQIHTAYPDARFEVDGQGMTLFHSSPPIRKRLVVLGSQECAIGGGEGIKPCS